MRNWSTEYVPNMYKIYYSRSQETNLATSSKLTCNVTAETFPKYQSDCMYLTIATL